MAVEEPEPGDNVQICSVSRGRSRTVYTEGHARDGETGYVPSAFFKRCPNVRRILVHEEIATRYVFYKDVGKSREKRYSEEKSIAEIGGESSAATHWHIAAEFCKRAIVSGVGVQRSCRLVTASLSPKFEQLRKLCFAQGEAGRNRIPAVIVTEIRYSQ